MNRSEIIDRLKAFLLQEFPNQGVALTESTDLLGEWFVDSLGIIETVLYLEKTFAIDIRRADINGDNFSNIATLADFISRRLDQGQAG
ncbi:MAG: phosphopantetheine-binding protein [Gammaproteobacteria bacterium]|jgi:acyl carrier protein